MGEKKSETWRGRDRSIEGERDREIERDRDSIYVSSGRFT